MIICPACNSDMPMLLGVLGHLAHLRCRHCGIDFTIEASELEQD